MPDRPSCFRFVAGLLLLALWTSCGSEPEDTAEAAEAAAGEAVAATVGDRQLNLSILLDLSDRIEPSVHPASPEHFERDLEAVETVLDYFRADMRQRGAFVAAGKIKTFFSPPPDNPEINDIASRLRIDLEGMPAPQKKAVYDSLNAWYAEGLAEIYADVIDTKDYVGADIWRFFKEGRVRDYAIEPDYRNILVILTDGYLYHERSTDRAGNRTAYLTGPLLSREGLRDASSRREKFDAGDYGFIPADLNLEDLEVLVLEVNPAEDHPNDLELLRAYWERWFEEMNVGRYRIIRTDLPTNTRDTILRFLSEGA